MSGGKSEACRKCFVSLIRTMTNNWKVQVRDYEMFSKVFSLSFYSYLEFFISLKFYL